MATYLIGDIQGCLSSLQQLLDKIRFDPAADRLWSCGDLVNRGGHSLEVLRLMRSLGDRVVVTLGNHDFYLLIDHARYALGNSKNREFRTILQAHDREALLGWLQHQPLAHWSAEHGLLLVHAGVVPQWSQEQTLAYAGEVEQVLRSPQAASFLLRIEEGSARRWKDERTGLPRLRMIASILTRIRFCDEAGKILWDANGPPGSQPEPYQPWFKHKNRATRNVRMAFGHWAALGVRIKRKFIALDSGCVWGGRLTAFRLEDEALFQVPGKYG